MTLRRRLAAALSLLTGVVVVYFALTAPRFNLAAQILVGVGIVLLVDALICFRGFTAGFYGSAAMSLLVILSEARTGDLLSTEPFTLVLLSTITLVFDLIALTARTKLTEQGNPMNLPVFG